MDLPAFTPSPALAASDRQSIDTFDESVLAGLAQLGALATGCPYTALYLRASDGSRRGVNVEGDDHEPPPFVGTPCEIILRTGEPLLIDDLEADRRYSWLAAEYGLHAYAGQPITFRGATVGTVVAMHWQPGALDAATLTTLDQLAAQVAPHLESQRRLLALEAVAEHGENALAALERSEASLHTIVASLPDGLLLQDGSGRTLVTNDAFCNLIGLPAPEHVIGLSRSDLRALIAASPAAGVDRLLKRSAEAIAANEPVFNGDGHDLSIGDRIAEWTFLPLRLDDGRERRLWHLRDVTERRLAERRAAASERRFIALATADRRTGIFQVDAEGTPVYTDAVCRELYGVDGEPNAETWMAAVHPDDIATVVQAWTETLRTGGHFSAGYRVVHADGLRDVEAEGAPIRADDGSVTGFIGSVMDVTERNADQRAREQADVRSRSEQQRLLDFVAGCPAPILTLDGEGDGRITNANPAADSMFGVAGEDAVGRSVVELVSGADREMLRMNLQLARSSGARTEPFEVVVLGRRPQVSLAEVTLFPHGSGAEGEPVQLTAMFRDVSAQHHAWLEQVRRVESERVARESAETAQAELEERLQELHAVTRAKEGFLATISHELRTPLTSIRTFAEILAEEGGGADDAPEAVISRNVERLERLVGDLLDLKDGVQSDELELTDVDLRALVHHEVTAQRPKAQAARIDLVFGDDGPIHATVDRARIGQVIGNLLDNALKFTPADGHVTAGARIVDGEAVIEVTDTGRGIDPAEAPHIFERFFQGAAGRDHAKGSGLGLSIAAYIAEAHGGRMDLRSTPGSGATLRLILPPTLA